MPSVSKGTQKSKGSDKPLPVWRQKLADWRRQQIAKWRRPLIGVAMALPILGAIAGGAYWAVASGWVARTQNAMVHDMLDWSARLGLAIEDVRVVGRQEVPKETILAILNVKQGDPILGFDPETARAQLERLSWVGSVTIRRQLPNLIQIRLNERQPAALWQRDGEISLIDADGHVLDTADVTKYRHLPLLAGHGAATKTHDLFALIAYAPEIAERLVAAAWIGERRWDLTLDNEVVIHLPELSAADALERLMRVQEEHQILDQDVLSIDLRYDDRLVVQTPSPEVAQRIDPQQSL